MHKSNILRILIVTILLLLFVFQAATSIVKRSNTWDESGHLLAGYAYLKEGMDYLEPSHPVLGRLIAAVPLLSFDLRFEPEKVTTQTAPRSNFYPYSLKFLFENNVDGKRLLYYSRMAIILLATVLGFYVFLWAKMLFGDKGGYLALFLYSLSPNMLAYGGLITTDLPITAFFFIAVFHLYLLAKRITPIRAVMAGITVGLALTAKYTALFIVPIYFMALIMSYKKTLSTHLSSAKDNGESWEKKKEIFLYWFLVILIAYITIWCVYGFNYRSERLSSYSELQLIDEMYPWANKGGIASTAISVARSIYFLPESYLYGLERLMDRSQAGHPSFLMGSYSIEGWWYYFIVAFLIKTPIPTLFFLTAAFLYFSRIIEKKSLFFVFFLTPIIVFFFMNSSQKINLGIRHMLPVYPFMFVFIGGLTRVQSSSPKVAKKVFFSFLLWYLVSTAAIYPYHIAYFNEFIGGPQNGYKFLVDSNLDWGQDLVGLKEYMDEKGIEKIKLAYFGMSKPEYYGISYEYLPSSMIIDPKEVKSEIELKGYFAISATMLQGVYLSDRDFYKIFREIKPIDHIGYSIFIYKLN